MHSQNLLEAKLSLSSLVPTVFEATTELVVGTLRDAVAKRLPHVLDVVSSIYTKFVPAALGYIVKLITSSASWVGTETGTNPTFIASVVEKSMTAHESLPAAFWPAMSGQRASSPHSTALGCG